MQFLSHQGFSPVKKIKQ